MASLKPKNPFAAKANPSKAPKNMGGKLPAGIGKQKTDHGKMKMFAKGGKVKGC